MGLLLSNWKIFAALIFLAGIYFYHTNAVDNAYDKGVSVERKAWKDKVKAEDEANRKYEKLVQDAVDSYGKKLLDESEKRIGTETVYKNNIETRIKDNPIYLQCEAETEVLTNINDIRKLGPTP
jgi:hypothetical protein